MGADGGRTVGLPPAGGTSRPDTVDRLTVDAMLVEARRGLDRLEPGEAHAAAQERRAKLVDVRTSDSRLRDGRLAGALEVSLNVLEWRLDPDSPARDPAAPEMDELVVVICEQGYSSSLAARRLRQLGFRHATDIVGGFEAWETSGLPVVRSADL